MTDLHPMISARLIRLMAVVAAVGVSGGVPRADGQEDAFGAPRAEERTSDGFGDETAASADDDPFGGSASSVDPFGEPTADRSRSAENRVQQLVQRIRRGDAGDAGRAELRELLMQRLNAQLQRQRVELETLAKRMQQLEQSLELRERNRTRIVERRVEELLDPSVRWEGLPPSHPAVLSGAGDRTDSESAARRARTEDAFQGDAGAADKNPFSSDTDDAEFTSDRRETPGGWDAAADRPAAFESVAEWATVLELLTEARDKYKRSLDLTRREIASRSERVRQLVRTLENVDSWPDSDLGRGQTLNIVRRDVDLIDSSDARLRDRIEQLSGDAPAAWRQAWSYYEHTLRLLELDIRAAEIQLQQANEQLVRSRSLFERGALSQSELSAATGALQFAELRMERGRERLISYRQIVEQDPTLDPENRPVHDLASEFEEIPQELRETVNALLEDEPEVDADGAEARTELRR